MITDLMLNYWEPFWLISTFLEIGLLLTFCRPMEKRVMSPWAHGATVVALVLLWHGNHLLHLDFAFDFLINSILATTYLSISKRAHKGQALYVACVFILCNEIGKIVTVDICMQPFFDRLSLASGWSLALVWIILTTAFTAISLYAVQHWVFGAGMELLSWRQSLCILLPLLPYVYLRNGSYVYDYSNRGLYYDMVVTLILLSLCTVAIIVTNAHNLSVQMNRNEILQMRSLLHDQHLQYITQRSAAEAINRRYHDLKQFAGQLERLASGSAESASDIQAFASSLQKEIAPFDLDVQTGNGVLDILLTKKRRICLEKEIAPTFYVNAARLGFINDFDLCTLVGNAVDNAIEATEKLPADAEREFSLTIACRNNLAIINCRNRFIGPPISSSSLPCTTKPSAHEHGLGLKSIMRVAEQYGGHMSWEAEDDNFTLSIIIPVP